MWRFMLVTFGFLGFAFYQMSGGSSYVPVANSIQARAADKLGAPEAEQVAALEPQGSVFEEEGEVTRASASLSDLALAPEPTQNEERYEITLASVQPSNEQEYVPTITAEPADVNAAAAAIDAAVQAALGEEPARTEVFSLETYANASAQGLLISPASGDIREVTGNVVNMRAGPGTEYQAVGKVDKGTEIAVLDEPGNGWVRLEVVSTGETGWMADWLVTASN